MKKNNIKKEYIQSLQFLKESKNYIFLIIGIFILFFLIAFLIPTSEELTKVLFEFIQQIIEQTKDMNFIELFVFIFLNNLKASFMGMILGVLIGIFPILFTIANAYLIGFVSSMVTKKEGLIALWKLLPHGIFELPAIFISLGLGLKIGTFIFKKDKINNFKEYTIKSIKTFILIIIPLLIIAALIESILIFIIG